MELKDITVSVKISEPAADAVQIVKDTADKNNYQIIVKPIEFEIVCSSGNKAVKLSAAPDACRGLLHKSCI